MHILIVATSLYNDRFATDWRPDLRYTTSFLRSKGIEAGYIYEPALASPGVVARCGALAPEMLFLEISEETRSPALTFLARFKRAHSEVLVAAGGIPATLRPMDFLGSDTGIDCIVAGERDATLVEAVERLRRGDGLGGVAGLQSKDSRNPPRPLLENLDSLGQMAHDGLAELLHPIAPPERVGYLVSSRGCYANCSFCGIPAFFRYSGGMGWRGRSPDVVVAEMFALREQFEISKFVFLDDDFIGPGEQGQERARCIAEEIIRRRQRIEYFICCRLNDVRRRTFELLKQSGLEGVGVSVESMNQPSLNLLGKGLRADAIYPVLELLEGMGIRCEVNLIFFDPYATLEGVRKNLALLDYLRKSEYLSYSDAFPFNELTAFPWSRVAAMLRNDGLSADENGRVPIRDQRVARLAQFVGCLRRHIPCCFKKTFLFERASAADTSAGSLEAQAMASRFLIGLRRWIGLEVLPRTVYAACEVLESGSGDVEARLEELEGSFENAVTPLRTLEQEVLRYAVGQSHE